jgi:osmotically-inducible protein OsmY
VSTEKNEEETMGKLASNDGFVRAGLLLLVLIIIVGVLYLTRRSGVNLDVAETGKAVAGDLEQAADTVRETSADAFLTAKVKTALALSKSASAFSVDVDSDGGTVTLTGAAPSNEIKEAVLDVVRDTEGVLQVVDRVQIDPRAVSGTEKAELVERLAELKIESAVYERLLHAEGVDARWIRVSVDGRVVQLSGTVSDPGQKERAASLVASVPGVEKVLNQLEVTDGAASAVSSPDAR